MAIEIRIIGPKELSTSQTKEFNVYAPMSLKGVYLSNTTSGNLTVEMWIKPALAVTILANQKFLGTVTILANDMRDFSDLSIPMDTGDDLYFQASGTGLNCIVVAEDMRP